MLRFKPSDVWADPHGQGAIRLLTFSELCSVLKADEPTVLSLVEAGSVPPPVNIGNRLIRWVESDLVRSVQTGCPSFPPLAPEELALIHRQEGIAEIVGGIDVEESEQRR